MYANDYSLYPSSSPTHRSLSISSSKSSSTMYATPTNDKNHYSAGLYQHSLNSPSEEYYAPSYYQDGLAMTPSGLTKSLSMDSQHNSMSLMNTTNHLSGSSNSGLTTPTNSLTPTSTTLSPTPASGSLGNPNYNTTTSLLNTAPYNRDIELYNTKYKKSVLEMALTQQGSKNLQSFLSELDHSHPQFSLIIDDIIAEVKDSLYILVIDTFGNYFIQLLFSCCNDDQKVIILESLSQHFSEISKDKIGTFAIQNILDYCSNNVKLGEIVINSLKDYVIDLVYDTRATHVIQRCIRLFKDLHISYLVDTLKDNCVDAAKNRNGSMVLRLCLDVVDKKTKLLLSKDLIESAVVLSGHPVGNYVIQHLLEPPPNGTYDDIDLSIINAILHKLAGSYVELSKQKFSSNVVEKCLLFITETEYQFILDELFEPKAFVSLLCNHFGCYVLQRAISLPIYSKYHDRIYRLIYDNFELLNAHGNNMLNKWKQVLNHNKDYASLFVTKNL